MFNGVKVTTCLKIQCLNNIGTSPLALKHSKLVAKLFQHFFRTIVLIDYKYLEVNHKKSHQFVVYDVNC